MTYAIGTIVYGFDLTELSIPEKLFDLYDDLFFIEGNGFHENYSGHDVSPRFMGIVLSDFDLLARLHSAIASPFTDMKITPSQKDIDELDQYLNNLKIYNQELYDIISKLERCVFVSWGTS